MDAPTIVLQFVIQVDDKPRRRLSEDSAAAYAEGQPQSDAEAAPQLPDDVGGIVIEDITDQQLPPLHAPMRVSFESVRSVVKPPSLRQKIATRIKDTFVKFQGAHAERPMRERFSRSYQRTRLIPRHSRRCRNRSVRHNARTFELSPMSSGASAVLPFGVPKSPLSQPRNFIGLARDRCGDWYNAAHSV